MRKIKNAAMLYELAAFFGRSFEIGMNPTSWLSFGQMRIPSRHIASQPH